MGCEHSQVKPIYRKSSLQISALPPIIHLTGRTTAKSFPVVNNLDIEILPMRVVSIKEGKCNIEKTSQPTKKKRSTNLLSSSQDLRGTPLIKFVNGYKGMNSNRSCQQQKQGTSINELDRIPDNSRKEMNTHISAKDLNLYDTFTLSQKSSISNIKNLKNLKNQKRPIKLKERQQELNLFTNTSPQTFLTSKDRLGNRYMNNIELLMNMKNRNTTFNPEKNNKKISLFGREIQNSPLVGSDSDEMALPRSRTFASNNLNINIGKYNPKSLEVYMEVDDLGRGSFSIVKKVLHTEENVFYAMKIINIRSVALRLRSKFNEKLGQLMERATLLAFNEQDILRLFSKSDNVLYSISSFWDDSQEDKKTMRIVIPLIAYGSLLSPTYMNAFKLQKFLCEDDARHIFRNITIGLKQVHDHNVIHRDLKPTNILMAGKYEANIADFSVSIFKENSLEQKMLEFEGSKSHKAPELWLNPLNADKANDVWSLGLILWEMLFGSIPFTLTKELVTLKNEILFKKLDFPFEISESLGSLLMSLLERDPHKRIRVENIIIHPWVRNCHEV